MQLKFLKQFISLFLSVKKYANTKLNKSERKCAIILYLHWHRLDLDCLRLGKQLRVSDTQGKLSSPTGRKEGRQS